MTFYRVLRKKHEEDVPPHEHQTDEVNGVFGFLRALKGKIDGSFRVEGDLTVAADSDLIVGDENSSDSQFKVHNIQSHISMFETDDPDYPDKFAVFDVNGQVVRIFWTDAPSTHYERFRIYGPTHATKAHDIEFVDSAGNIVMAWDQSDGRWELTTDLVGDTDNDFYSRSYRTRVGPDASDFWIIGEQNSGDTIRIAQWDQSAGTNLARFDFNGRGTGVSNAGDMIFYDEGGTEILRWDQSALAFLFAQGVLQAEDGSASAPAYSFNAAGQTDVGFYRAGTDAIGATVGGVEVAQFNASSIGSYQQTEYYTADDTFTKANYPGLKAIIVEMVGAGGGGGGCATTSSTQGAAGGGGGGGAYARALVLASNLDTTEAITVGTGGAGNDNADGSAGEDSVFDTISGEVRADGGAGGVAGAAATPPFIGQAGGAGGLVAGSTGDLTIPGQAGTNPVVVSTSAATGAVKGAGGDSQFGAGNHGTRDLGNGNTGGLYGGGGSGAFNTNTQAATRTGGAGADGLVLVHIYV